ncbi:MAG TPA: protoporphyrinogen oxidase [Ignavibacteria bacterium]|nr:protoporphyrinogen oxidase [Ignavibacteria bacterium]
MNKKILILGAGISGLSVAHFLNKEGYGITVLEKNDVAGGSMVSVSKNGFLIDYGPNSGLETTPLIGQLIEDLKLQDELIYANKKGNKRYILKNNRLYPLPMNPSMFFKTKLFSGKAKLRLLAEPLIGRSRDGYYQSISEFVKRRLGKEFLDYAINPFVAGVYAGNPDQLSVKSAFPKLYALEEKYGGLIVGAIKSMKERKHRQEKPKQSAKMFSFKSGMQTLPKAIAKELRDKVIFSAEVNGIEKKGNGYEVTYTHQGIVKTTECDILLSAIPAYAAASLFKNIDEKLAMHLSGIFYPPVYVLYIGYEKSSIKQPLDGFGFLIPSKENKSYLGAIWSSVIFENRSENDKSSFTLFIGGARNPEVISADREALFKKVLNEFHEIMGITFQPVFSTFKFWQKAIPQYNTGYIEHENYFNDFEKKNPGILLGGNYRGGISVGDCIKNSQVLTNKIKKLCASVESKEKAQGQE